MPKTGLAKIILVAVIYSMENHLNHIKLPPLNVIILLRTCVTFVIGATPIHLNARNSMHVFSKLYTNQTNATITDQTVRNMLKPIYVEWNFPHYQLEQSIFELRDVKW